jgi:hypothetical protein
MKQGVFGGLMKLYRAGANMTRKNMALGIILVTGLLVSCASPSTNTSVSSTPNVRNLEDLQSVNSLSIKRIECGDSYIEKSVINGLTDGLLSKGINVVSGESADAFIEGVVSITSDSTSSAGGTQVGNFSGAHSESSAGGYVNNIAVKVIGKTGALLGTATVTQSRKEATPQPPAYEGRRLGIAISKLFDKNAIKYLQQEQKHKSMR